MCANSAQRVLILTLSCCAFGCGIGQVGGGEEPEVATIDAQSEVSPDGGNDDSMPGEDLGVPLSDAGPPTPDAMRHPPDSGQPRADNGSITRDCNDGVAHGETQSRVRYQAATVPYGAVCKQETQRRTCTNGVFSSWSGSYAATSCKVLPPADCGSFAHGQTQTRVRYQAATVPYGAVCKQETQRRTCTNGVFSSWSGSYAATSCRVPPWEQLLSQRLGFGRQARGGSGGPLCQVTTLADSGPGSLRACAEANGPRWIHFKVSGVIDLQSDIAVKSYKTIDGRGAAITIRRYGVAIRGVEHVIIHNLRFDEGRDGVGDAISLKNHARHVWIDHVHLEEYGDGLLDITGACTDITISWSRFEDHDKVMIIGLMSSGADESVIRVTLHHNRFSNTVQRHPRLQSGRVHAFNNYLRKWSSYGMASCRGGQLYSERNIFEADADKRAIRATDCPSDAPEGYVNSSDDWKLNGALVDENKNSRVFRPRDHYSYTPDRDLSALRNALNANAGRRSVPFPR
jgi:pectate lyase